MIVHRSRVDFLKARLFISRQPDRPSAGSSRDGMLHLREQRDRRVRRRAVCARHSRAVWIGHARSQPASPVRRARRREEIVREMHHRAAASAIGGRVVAHRDKFPASAHEKQIVDIESAARAESHASWPQHSRAIPFRRFAPNSAHSGA